MMFCLILLAHDTCFSEPVSFGRLFFIFTLIVSIVGLKVVSS